MNNRYNVLFHLPATITLFPFRSQSHFIQENWYICQIRLLSDTGKMRMFCSLSKKKVLLKRKENWKIVARWKKPTEMKIVHCSLKCLSISISGKRKMKCNKRKMWLISFLRRILKTKRKFKLTISSRVAHIGDEESCLNFSGGTQI